MDHRPFLRLGDYRNAIYFKNSDTTIEVFDSTLAESD